MMLKKWTIAAIAVVMIATAMMTASCGGKRTATQGQDRSAAATEVAAAPIASGDHCDEATVYVVGHDMTKRLYDGVDDEVGRYDQESAVIWGNGIGKALNDNRFPHFRQYVSGAIASSSVGVLYGRSPSVHSVYVSGGDVYAAGMVSDAYYDIKAVLWINGVPKFLDDNRFSGAEKPSEATAVYVSGNDVYAVGWVGISDLPRATLWKNDVSTLLSDSTSAAQSIYVSDSDVYAAGWVLIDGHAKAALWKNSVTQFLDDTPSDSGLSQAFSIYVSDSDVYVGGWVGISGFRRATLWKNGTPDILSDSASMIKSVHVSGGDVYAAGFVMSSGVLKAALWKNSALSILNDSVSRANSVHVSGGDVYVAGYVGDEGSGEIEDDDEPLNLGNQRAALWKNGDLTLLSAKHSGASSVFVGCGRNMDFGQDDYAQWRNMYTGRAIPVRMRDPASTIAEDFDAPQTAGGKGKSWGAAINPASVVRDTFTDTRDNQTYRTVRIGNLTWMAENLNYRTDYSRCYDDDDSNCAKYGRLYYFNDAKTACPAGWRLPCRDDWDDLVTAVGGFYDTLRYGGWETVEIAGGKLKSRSGWHNNGNGTDDFGFSALPGGVNVLEGGDRPTFSDIGLYGSWLTSLDLGGGTVTFSMSWEKNVVHRNGNGIGARGDLHSVRCVRD